MSTTDTPKPTMIGLDGNLTGDPELLTFKGGKPWMEVRLSVKRFIHSAGEQPTKFCDPVTLSSNPDAALAAVPPGGSPQPVVFHAGVPTTHRPPGASRTEHPRFLAGAR